MNHPFSPQELERFAARLAKLSGGAIEPATGGPTGARIADAKVEAALSEIERAAGAKGVEKLDALLGLDDLLGTAIDQLAPQDVSTVLRRIVSAFGATSSERLRQAIRGRVLGFFETTVKSLLRGERLDKVEPFVTRFVDAVRGSDLVGGHQLGRVMRQVDDTLRTARKTAEKAGEDERLAEVDPQARAADRLVRKLIARSDVAASIAVVRTLGLDAESRSRKFLARFDSRTLGINIGVLQRFESALRIPDQAMRFDKRFQILSSIFPEMGGDEDAFGKFGWMVGMDVAGGVGEGYDGALFGLDALAFAAPSVIPGLATPSLDLGGLGGLGGRLAGLDLGAVRRSGMATEVRKMKPLDKPTTKIGGLSKSLAAKSGAIRLDAGGRSERADVAAMFGGKMVRLPKDAIAALEARDLGRFERAVTHSLPAEVARAVLRNVKGGRAPALGGGFFARTSAPAAAPARLGGGLGHVALGFQGLAQTGARERALDGLGRMVRGGGGGGLGYVAASPSAAMRVSLPAAVGRMSLPGAAMSLPRGSHGGLGAVTALASTRGHALGALPLPGRAVTFDRGASFGRTLPQPAADALRLAGQGGSTTVVRAALAAPRFAAAAPSHSTVPAYAISNDGFGVPRFRGARPMSTQSLRALEGFDLQGSVVIGSRAASGAMRLPTGSIGPISGGVPAAIRSSVSQGFAGSLGAAPAPRGAAPVRLPQLSAQGGPAVRPAALRGIGGIALPAPFAPIAASGRSSLGAALLAGGAGPRPAAIRDEYGIVRMGARGRAAAAPADVRIVDLAGSGHAVSLPGLSAASRTSPRAIGAMAPSLALAGHRVVAPALALGAAAVAMPASRPSGRSRSSASVSPRGRAAAPEAAGFVGAPTAAGLGALPSLSASRPGTVATANAGARAGIRAGREPAVRSTSFGSVADIHLDRHAADGVRPQSLDKYYAPVSSTRLGVGRLQGFQLQSFSAPQQSFSALQGSAPRGGRAAPASVGAAIGGDYAPAGLARFAATGSRPQDWRVAYDEAGFAPVARLGRVGPAAGSTQRSAERHASRFEGSLDRLRGTYSGARLKATGSGASAGGAVQELGFRGGISSGSQMLAASAGADSRGGQALVAPRGAAGAPAQGGGPARGGALSTGQAGPARTAGDRAGPQTLASSGSAAPGSQRLEPRASGGFGRQVEATRGRASGGEQRLERGATRSERAARFAGPQPAGPAGDGYAGFGASAAPASRLPARRPERRAEPRLAGIYGGTSEAQELATSGGADVLGLARHSGYEARRAPTAVSRRYEVLGADMSGGASSAQASSGQRLEPSIGGAAVAAQRLEPSIGAAAAAAQRLEPSFGAAASAAQRLAPAAGSARGGVQDAALAATTRAPAQAQPAAGSAPGSAPQASAPQARRSAPAARSAARATEREVFGLIPKQVSGQVRDRFRLDGWMPQGGLSGSAGGVGVGLRPRSVQRGGPDLRVEHAFVQFRGQLGAIGSEGAIPVDLTSQLSGRSQLAARSARARQDRGVEFALRNFEVPQQGLFWARSETGEVQHREVPFRLRYQALEPQHVYGRLGSAEPRIDAAYDVRPTQRGARSAPQTRQGAGVAGLRQQPGAASLHALNVHVAAKFAPEGTDVSWSQGMGADLALAAGFRRRVSRRAQQVLLGRQRQQELGLDVGRANELLARNLDAIREARRLYRAGVRMPVGPAWRLQVELVGDKSDAEGPAGRAPALRFATPSAAPSVGQRWLEHAEVSPAIEMTELAETLVGRRERPIRGEGAPQRLAAAGGAATTPARSGGRGHATMPTMQRRAPRLGSAPARADGQVLHAEQRGGAPQELAAPAAPVAYVAQQPSYRRDAEAEAAPRRREERGQRARPERERVVGEPFVTADRRELEDIELYEARGIQRKTHWVADTQMQRGVTDGDRMPRVEGARKPAPPVANITQLVYQIYNRLKRELEVDMERRTGSF